MPRQRNSNKPDMKSVSPEWTKRMNEVEDETQEHLNGFYRKNFHRNRSYGTEVEFFVNLECGGSSDFIETQTATEEDWRRFRFRRDSPEAPAFAGLIKKDGHLCIIRNLLKTNWPRGNPVNRAPCRLLLCAHQLNTLERMRTGKEEHEMGRSVWFLPDEDYRRLERAWQRTTGNTVTFADYCGVPKTFTHSVPPRSGNAGTGNGGKRPVKRSSTVRGNQTKKTKN